jgi:hypothetical protein
MLIINTEGRSERRRDSKEEIKGTFMTIETRKIIIINILATALLNQNNNINHNHKKIIIIIITIHFVKQKYCLLCWE